jgi:hypothetical protein
MIWSRLTTALAGLQGAAVRIGGVGLRVWLGLRLGRLWLPASFLAARGALLRRSRLDLLLLDLGLTTLLCFDLPLGLLQAPTPVLCTP